MQEQPKRIQRKVTKGWRLPGNTVYVGRGTVWENPFIPGVDGTPEECLEKHKEFMMPYTHQSQNGLEEFIISSAFLESVEYLRGKNLACWCKPEEPCHGDFLLEVANLL